MGMFFNFNYLMNNDIPRIEYSFKFIVKVAHLMGFNQQFIFFCLCRNNLCIYFFLALSILIGLLNIDT